jgi:hypothetical protein
MFAEFEVGGEKKHNAVKNPQPSGKPGARVAARLGRTFASLSTIVADCEINRYSRRRIRRGSIRAARSAGIVRAPAPTASEIRSTAENTLAFT